MGTTPPPTSRKRTVVCIGAAFFLAIFVGLFARHHLYCGFVAAYMYATWVRPQLPLITQAAIDAHASGNSSGYVPPIPKIIHQTWKDEHIPERWAESVASCRELHEDYEYMLWTDASSRAFVAEHYPWFLRTYDRYPWVIQRADVIRYLVLYKYGGAYVDLDVGCRRRLDDLREFPLVLPLTTPLGFSNEFMMSAPGHPFTRRLVQQLPRWAHTFFTKYPSVMFSTGPMYVTAQYALYTGGRVARDVAVLPDNFYGKFSNGSEAYLRHVSGSSWHGSDAKFVFWLYRHLSLLVHAGVAAAVLVAAAFAYVTYVRGPSNKCEDRTL